MCSELKSVEYVHKRRTPDSSIETFHSVKCGGVVWVVGGRR